jgi:hypothetical protein
MRLLVLCAALLALGVSACGDENETPTTTSASTALPLTVERSGGVAGINDKLVVRADGTGTFTSNNDAAQELTADDTARVRSALRELVFSGLDERYEPPSGTQIADGIDYKFSAGGDTIVVEEMAEDVPDPLDALKAAAATAMNDAEE